MSSQEDRRHVIRLLEDQAYEEGYKVGYKDAECEKPHMPIDWMFDEWDIEQAKRLAELRKKVSGLKRDKHGRWMTGEDAN